MNRPGQLSSVLMFLFLLAALPGCSDEKPDDGAGGEGASGSSKPDVGSSGGTGTGGTETTGSTKPGHEGHDHGDDGKTAGDSTLETGAPDLFNLKPVVPALIPERDNIAGRWLLRIVHAIQPPNQEQGVPPALGERPLMLVSVTPGEGDDPGSVLPLAGVEAPFKGAALVNAKASGTRVEFTGNSEEGEKAFDFQGTFVDGAVIGSIRHADGTVLTARLVATDEKTLARIPGFDPFDEFPEFLDLQQTLVPEQFLQFAKDHPSSPLTRMALVSMVQSNCAGKRSTKDVHAAITAALDDQAPWGPRCVIQTRYQILQMLIQTTYDVDFSLKFIDEIEQSLESENLESQPEAPDLTFLRHQIKARRAYEELQAADAATRKQGVEHARELLKELPYSIIILHALADEMRKSGDTDEAIRIYGEIKAIPMQELLLRQLFAGDPVRRITPSERLADLWKKAERKEDLEEYLESIYNEKLLGFKGEPITERPDGKGNLLVLAELFTSSNSPESVAADLSVSALEKTLPDTMFVALRYHQHSRAPDALANEDSEARCYNFYGYPGAPQLLLNGRAVSGIPGSMNQTGPLHKRLRKLVVDRLPEESSVTIGLSATRQGETVRIQAQVDGADLANENLRLRIALTESDVPFTGINGIRRHDMIVRAMPGGDRGIAASDGALTFEGSVDLAALQKSLTDYLSNFEKQQGQKLTSKPLALEQLHVVAFVQDDATREVLQAAVVSLNAPAAE